MTFKQNSFAKYDGKPVLILNRRLTCSFQKIDFFGGKEKFFAGRTIELYEVMIVETLEKFEIEASRLEKLDAQV